MKVLSKILGAVLLLGCLAYISFVFGKYVLSSTLLKSIPKSERIISTDNPVPTNASTSSDQREYSPQVEMRVLPNTRPSRETTDNTGDDDSTNDSSNSNNADDDSKEPKKFDEGESSSPRHRRSRHKRNTEKSADTSNDNSTAKNSTTATQKKSSPSSSAPIRRLNQEEKTEDTSPVPKPEKSTSGSGDAANISPVPKPE
jgi:FtsZ-interacting cell division protein ZipA